MVTPFPRAATSDPSLPGNPTVTGVTVSSQQALQSAGPAQEVQSGDQMIASARFSDGEDRDVTTSASWTTSNPGVATVSSAGIVTVAAAGIVELRATYQNVAGSLVVVVEAPAAPAIFVLDGIVRNGSTGQPLEGVRVQIVGDVSGRVTTDEIGSYVFTGLPAGRILIEFTRDGYQYMEISVEMAGSQRQDVSLNPTGQ